MRPKWSWSNSSFPSHDPLLSPLADGPTLSSFTWPLITCTGSKLIFTIEDHRELPPPPTPLCFTLTRTQGSPSARRGAGRSASFRGLLLPRAPTSAGCAGGWRAEIPFASREDYQPPLRPSPEDARSSATRHWNTLPPSRIPSHVRVNPL